MSARDPIRAAVRTAKRRDRALTRAVLVHLARNGRDVAEPSGCLLPAAFLRAGAAYARVVCEIAWREADRKAGRKR